jgi:hypothetical protein
MDQSTVVILDELVNTSNVKTKWKHGNYSFRVWPGPVLAGAAVTASQCCGRASESAATGHDWLHADGAPRGPRGHGLGAVLTRSCAWRMFL